MSFPAGRRSRFASCSRTSSSTTTSTTRGCSLPMRRIRARPGARGRLVRIAVEHPAAFAPGRRYAYSEHELPPPRSHRRGRHPAGQASQEAPNAHLRAAPPDPHVLQPGVASGAVRARPSSALAPRRRHRGAARHERGDLDVGCGRDRVERGRRRSLLRVAPRRAAAATEAASRDGDPRTRRSAALRPRARSLPHVLRRRVGSHRQRAGRGHRRLEPEGRVAPGGPRRQHVPLSPELEAAVRDLQVTAFCEELTRCRRLPRVETIRAQLAPRLEGRVLERRDPRSAAHPTERPLRGRRGVSRATA